MQANAIAQTQQSVQALGSELRACHGVQPGTPACRPRPRLASPLSAPRQVSASSSAARQVAACSKGGMGGRGGHGPCWLFLSSPADGHRVLKGMSAQQDGLAAAAADCGPAGGPAHKQRGPGA